MITKYYNASNNFSAPIIREPRPKPETIVPVKPPPPPKEREEPSAPAVQAEIKKPAKQGGLGGLLDGILGGFESDDLILLGLLLILISDSDDTFLTLIIGYLFISGL